MEFLLTCPNSVLHRKFCATAVVTQTWVCDDKGQFVDVAEDGTTNDVIRSPNADDPWECFECGAVAQVTWRSDLCLQD